MSPHQYLSTVRSIDLLDRAAIYCTFVKISVESSPENSYTVPKTKPTDICKVRCFNTDLVSQVRDSLPDDESLETAEILFTALADKSRLKILYALKDAQELCVCDLAAVLGVQTSAASHHLRKLRDLKLLKYRNDGKLVYYSLRDESVSQVLNHVFAKDD